MYQYYWLIWNTEYRDRLPHKAIWGRLFCSLHILVGGLEYRVRRPVDTEGYMRMAILLFTHIRRLEYTVQRQVDTQVYMRQFILIFTHIGGWFGIQSSETGCHSMLYEDGYSAIYPNWWFGIENTVTGCHSRLHEAHYSALYPYWWFGIQSRETGCYTRQYEAV